jgi:hypothetical protein
MNANAGTADGHATAADWWRGAVIYQIYPRSFRDTDGDGVGDLRGIFEKLDYVADLGVDGVWLSPFFRSPMKDFGYDVSDYCDVDPLFGSIADFDAVLGRAHALGLKVIIDRSGRIPRINTPGSWKAARPDRIRRLTGMSGPTPGPTAHLRTTGWRRLAGHPGPGTRGAGNITCMIS